MKTILHITTPEAWDAAGRTGAYTAPSLDTEGFIHCSLPEQVAAVANAIYARREDLVLLWIDAGRVAPAIRYEGTPDAYPHIYGPLNIDAVLEVTPWQPGEDGRFRTPSCDTATGTSVERPIKESD